MRYETRVLLILTLLMLLLTLAGSCTVPAVIGPPEGELYPGNPLPAVGTPENLQRLVRQAHQQQWGVPFGFVVDTNGMDLAGSASLRGQPAEQSGDYPDHSTTNVQVQGVDEGDVVKSDGEYIYFVNGQRIAVVRAYPPEEISLVSEKSFAGGELWPHEIYIDGDLLVVVGWSQREFSIEEKPALREESAIYPPPRIAEGTVRILVYDISDRSALTLLREVEVEGHYVSSRKIGSAFYLVANKYLDMHILEHWPGSAVPSYRDTGSQESFVKVDLAEIRYFPEFHQPNYLLLAGFDLLQNDRPVEVQTYLGAGENIYASRENLYVAVTRYHPDRDGGDYTASTSLYKFALSEGRISFRAEGEVPGTLLNQFSMDEYAGYLRMAVTTGNPWWGREGDWSNHLYVLDGSLRAVGKVEGMAPGERIYAARFMGEKGYLVTFRTVDPLFALDLSDPRRPAVLGELKIPGYSTYLHPFDENHLLGFGMDALEVPVKDTAGRVVDTVALDQGMKVALFDVSDMTNPVEKFVASIGGRGTYSELLHNHRALLFSRERELLAFAVRVAEDPGAPDPQDPWRHGRFTFQGAYVYRINAAEGFKLLGTVTHLPEGFSFQTWSWYDDGNYVQRVLYIGDVLYTLSPGAVQAHSLPALNPLGGISLERGR